MWTRGNHGMTLSSTRTSAAGEYERRGGVGGDRAGREKGRADRADRADVQPDNRHIDRHTDMRRRRDRQTDTGRETTVRRVRVTSWGQASICACTRVEEASTSILPRTTLMYTLHTCMGNMQWAPSRGGYWCEGDTFEPRRRLRKYREMLYLEAIEGGWQEWVPQE